MKNVIRTTIFFSLLLCGYANAVPCSVGPGVTANVGCFDGAAEDQNNDLADINAALSPDVYESLDRVEEVDPYTGTYWSGDFVGISGSFTLVADFWSTFTKAVVVLKDGRATDDIFWSGYLIDATTGLSYDWVFDGEKAISHMDLYAIRGDTPPPNGVPEPGTMALLGLGLLGMGLARRRIRS